MPIICRMHKMERHHKLLFCFTFANRSFLLAYSLVFKYIKASSLYPLSFSTHSLPSSNHSHFTSSFLPVLCNGTLLFSYCCSISHLNNCQEYFLVSKLRNVYKIYVWRCLSSLELQLYYLTYLFHVATSVSFEITHFKFPLVVLNSLFLIWYLTQL